MAAEDPKPKRSEADSGDAGIFANLPRSRPGTRSPRRGAGAGSPRKRRTAATKGQAAPGKGQAKPGPRAKAREPRAAARPGAEPKPRQRPAERSASEPAGTPAERHEGGIEGLAWAGVAAAAEAATLGVRLASRALEAARGAVERR